MSYTRAEQACWTLPEAGLFGRIRRRCEGVVMNTESCMDVLRAGLELGLEFPRRRLSEIARRVPDVHRHSLSLNDVVKFVI